VAGDGPKLWDVASGLEVSPLSEPSERVTASAFSPDGSWLVTASDQKTLKTWDAVTGRRLAVFSAGERVADDCAVSPDNTRILYGAYGVLGLIDSSTGAPIAAFHLPVDFWVMRCAFSADGTRVIAVNNHASELRLWNAGSAEELAALHKDVEYVSWLNTLNTGLRLDQDGWGFSRDGTLAVAVFYGALKVWSISNGVELARFVRVPEEEWEWHPRHLNYGRITAWALSPGATRLAIGYDDGATWMWETATGNLLWAGPEPQRQSIMSIAFSPGGTHLVSGSVNGRLILWDAADGMALASFLAHEQSLNACAFHPDGTTVLTASGDATLKLRDLLSL